MEDYENTSGKESPIANALKRLKQDISKVKEILPAFESLLASVVTQPEKTTVRGEENAASKAAGGRTHLESELILMIGEVVEIKEYLNSLQTRIQL